MMAAKKVGGIAAPQRLLGISVGFDDASRIAHVVEREF
jgi:hypothetical protein